MVITVCHEGDDDYFIITFVVLALSQLSQTVTQSAFEKRSECLVLLMGYFNIKELLKTQTFLLFYYEKLCFFFFQCSFSLFLFGQSLSVFLTNLHIQYGQQLALF